MYRALIPLMVSVFCLTANAQPAPPGAEPYYQFQLAVGELQQSVKEYESIVSVGSVDEKTGQAIAARITASQEKLDHHLAMAMKEGNAAAFYMKARLVESSRLKNPDRTKRLEAACAFYSEAAKRGFVAGAVAYVNCNTTLPKSPQYETSRTLLRNALNAPDLYKAEYPFAITHAYCFEPKLEPLKPDEDPSEIIKAFAKPTLLEAEEFRAEGFYRLAADNSTPKSSQSEQDLRSAFEAGCQTDGLRLKPKAPKAG